MIAPTLKYDAASFDFLPQSQGLYFDYFSSSFVYQGSVLINDDTWYYTRIKPITGTNLYESTTSTGNYENNGGIVISKRKVPVYTRSGYLSLVFLDNHSPNAYAVFGECKILKD